MVYVVLFIHGIFITMQTEKLSNKWKNRDEGTETEISCLNKKENNLVGKKIMPSVKKL